jgi:hypothetical protein
VVVSSSDTDEALEFLTIESNHDDLLHFVRNDTRMTSSESSIGSQWFEDWPEANDICQPAFIVRT